MSEPAPSSGALADALDTALLKAINEGVVVSDGNGVTSKIDAPAAVLKVALERVRMLGVLDPALPGSSQEELIKKRDRIMKRQLRLTGTDGPRPIDVDEMGPGA